MGCGYCRSWDSFPCTVVGVPTQNGCTGVGRWFSLRFKNQYGLERGGRIIGDTNWELVRASVSVCVFLVVPNMFPLISGYPMMSPNSALTLLTNIFCPGSSLEWSTGTTASGWFLEKIPTVPQYWTTRVCLSCSSVGQVPISYFPGHWFGLFLELGIYQA